MISPCALMKEPVPPRPAGPTDTSASERHGSLVDVPSIALAGTRRPMSWSAGSRAATSVMGQDLNLDGGTRDDMLCVLEAHNTTDNVRSLCRHAPSMRWGECPANANDYQDNLGVF